MATNIEEKSHNVPIEEVFQQSKLLENSIQESLSNESQILSFGSCEVNHSMISTFSMEEKPFYESHNIGCPIQVSMNENPLYESHNNVCPIQVSMNDNPLYDSMNGNKLSTFPMEENPLYESYPIQVSMNENPLYESYISVEDKKISQSTPATNILPNRICINKRMIIAMISIMFIILLVCIGLEFDSILIEPQDNKSSLPNQTNIKYNDDHFIFQAIKRRIKNGPCIFLIPREILKEYNISSWVLNDGEDGPTCHEYNLNFGHGAPHHQYIHLKPSRCGSICDNNTLKNTIHLKVKYDKFNERSISFPISCKTRGKLGIKYEFLTTCDSGEGISRLTQNSAKF